MEDFGSSGVSRVPDDDQPNEEPNEGVQEQEESGDDEEGLQLEDDIAAILAEEGGLEPRPCQPSRRC
jgi:hypothetical protein